MDVKMTDDSLMPQDLDNAFIYERTLTKPPKSFLLMGPRGTGKSTWLESLHFDLTIDLLNSRLRITLERDPHHLVELTAHLPPGAWIMIDEVQKIPTILDTVHFLYKEKKFNFALSGSSARKLKRSQTNLLGGRALSYTMYPLIFSEYTNRISLTQRMHWGTLPLVVNNPGLEPDTLESYVDNYLRQELIEEGIVRKIEPFSRFLQVAAIMNGQILNVGNIARESGVNRTTVDNYFEILVDTLIGYRIPAYQPGLKIKETSHPKFYFFDPGVARAAAGQARQPLGRDQEGFLLETLILNELRAYNDYSRKFCPLFYYAISGGGDIDFIVQTRTKTVTRSDQIIAIEVKLAEKWKSDWSQQLIHFAKTKGLKTVDKLIGIYTGPNRITQNGVDIYPVDLFLRALFDGEIF